MDNLLYQTVWNGLTSESVEAALAGRFVHLRDDPVLFVEQVLGGFPWSKQKEILEGVRDHPRVSVRSCHGVGKTWVAAATAIWFLFTRPNSIVITTAPTWRQVKELLWREIRGNFRKGASRGFLYEEGGDRIRDLSLFGTCNTTDLQVDGDQWYALGLSTDNPDKLVGFHAEDILLIGDEAAGISEEIFNAAQGILTTAGAKELLIGNPTSQSGRFHYSHHAGRANWKTVAISAYDSPAFTGEKVPASVMRKLVSPEWVEDRKREWGEDSAVFASRVLGQFPKQASDSLFGIQWIEDAGRRFEPLTGEQVERLRAAGVKLYDPTTDENQVEFGVDVARHGDCETVLYVRQGPRILYMDAWRNKALTWTADRIEEAAKRFGPAVIRVDATGMGAGVVDILEQKGLPVYALYVGLPAENTEQFPRIRDEMFVGLADRFRDGDVGPLICESPLTDPVEAAETTMAQLAAIKVKFDTRGRRVVESKDDMEKRGVRSPDRADALAMAFYTGGVSVAAENITKTDVLANSWTGKVEDPVDAYTREDNVVSPWSTGWNDD